MVVGLWFLVGLLTCPADAQDKLPEVFPPRQDAPVEAEAPALLDEGFDESALFSEIPSVYGASLYEQKSTDAPASVTVIGAEEIRRFGWRTLSDLLRSVGGVYVTSDHNYDYLGVRGFGRPGDYNNKVLILVDSHRISDSVYSAGPIGSEFVLDLELIDRVEIIRGPASALYGTNAVLSVINIWTKRGRDFQGAEVAGDWANRASYRGRVTWGQRFANGVEALVSGSVADSRGADFHFPELDAPETNFGRAEGKDWDQSYRAFGKLVWQDWSLTLAWVYRDKGIPTGSWGTVFNSPDNFAIDEYAYAALRYQRRFDFGLELFGRLHFDYYHYRGSYQYDYAEPPDAPDLTLLKDDGRGAWWGLELRGAQEIVRWLKVLAGFELRHNLHQDQSAWDKYEVYQHDTRSGFYLGAFLQAEVNLFERLKIFAGGRYDHYSTFGGTINPRASLVYQPFKSTSLKANISTAFRAPTAYELYYHDGYYTQKPNPELSPETIVAHELVWEQGWGAGLRSSLAVFYFELDKLIDLQEDPSDELLQFENQGAARMIGVEAALEAELPAGLLGRLSYSFQDTLDHAKMELTNLPHHLAKANLSVPLIHERLFAGMELQYLSSRLTLSGAQSGDVLLVNLSLFAPRVVGGLDLSAHAFNFFDFGYADPGSAEHIQDRLPQRGRTLMLRLKYAF
jgi:iron complex outermembrane receptor protein